MAKNETSVVSSSERFNAEPLDNLLIPAEEIFDEGSMDEFIRGWFLSLVTAVKSGVRYSRNSRPAGRTVWPESNRFAANTSRPTHSQPLRRCEPIHI